MSNFERHWLTSNGFVLTALAALALAAAPIEPARAVETGAFSMDVLVDGRTLVEYAARGTTYVEALKGREFAIRLSNGTADRVGIALSVDGLNSIDAKTTTAREARKWILDPHETITISGWQTGSSTARRFFFTTEQRSYGAWLGKTSNLGVISAAVFRERRPRPRPWSRTVSPAPGPGYDGSGQETPSAREQVLAEGPLGSAGAAAEGAPSRRHGEALEKRAVSDDLAATGIGRETSHPVIEVAFEAEDAPCSVLQVRYEYREALVRLGVLPAPRSVDEPLARRERARGFQEPGFAPDPYR